MRNRIVPIDRIFGIRAMEDAGRLWFLLEDVRSALKKPRLEGIGEKKYINADRGPWITVRLRLISSEALLEYARMYSVTPMEEWKLLIKALQEKSGGMAAIGIERRSDGDALKRVDRKGTGKAGHWEVTQR